jgi:predicted permease
MSPEDNELADEIRGHLAIEIQRRIDRGENPVSARQAALREFGNVTMTRESMERVWRFGWLEAVAALGRDIRIAIRSLRQAKGLAATVIVTLALAIGANAAIFSVVRGVLLRPLVNRDEDRLIYIRQFAQSAGADNITFSMPEIRDISSRVTSVAAFGDFSVADLVIQEPGGDPRTVRAGVVGGSFFEVMGLQPVLGRLLTAKDDGPQAPGVAVLTYRYWATAFHGDRSVVGRVVRLGIRNATIVGVLEPSVPYPADTELMSNIVTSPHHLDATMVTSRTHRMTDLFGRLAPGATIDMARAELTAVHADMVRANPEAYSTLSNVQISVTRLRDQIASPARTMLIVLLAVAAIVFLIACSNVANLILARSVRREGELAVRAALGASNGALRRALLAESLVLCGAGAIAGVILARPFVFAVAQYAKTFSVRALEVTVDSSVLWVGCGLAIFAAVVLAMVPRLPSSKAPAGLGLTSGVRITPGTNRRLRLFATTQIAFSFVLLAGAGMLLTTLVTLRSVSTGYDMRHVLAFNMPSPAPGAEEKAKLIAFYDDATRRIAQVPGVENVAGGNFVPWRDAGVTGPGFTGSFRAEGYSPATGEEVPRARFRIVSPEFFATVGVELIEGREFTEADRLHADQVSIVSQSVAKRYFPNAEALNRHIWWLGFNDSSPRRIVGVVADVDDEHVERGPAMTIYNPIGQVGFAGRLFVRAAGDPAPLIPVVERVVREIAADQPIEHAATLEEVRADVLSSDRLNAFVFSGFAGIALLIAIVGVAGVLAFSVSARTREFGVRLAIGLAPRQILTLVLSEGVWIAAIGVVAGAAAGLALARIAARIFDHVEVPGVWAAASAAGVLIAAAVVASLVPANRASRVDILQALRPE